MSKQDITQPAKILLPVGGMDESIQVVDSDVTFEKVSGASPFYLATLQRIFGKKLIDYNPEQSVMGICQAFNQYGNYGYYVQSMEKLYFHVCDAPPDFHINFEVPTTLGVDENNFTLNIFGQRQDATVPPNPAISCLFGFPDRPVPPPDPEEGTLYQNIIAIFNVLLTGSQTAQMTSLVWGTNFFASWIWNADGSGWVCWIVDSRVGHQNFIYFPQAATVGQEFDLQIKVKVQLDLTIRVTPTVDGAAGDDISTHLPYADFASDVLFPHVVQTQIGLLGSQLIGVDFGFKNYSIGTGLPHAADIFDASLTNVVVPPYQSIFTNLGGTPITATGGVMRVAYAGGGARFANAVRTTFPYPP